VGIWLSGRHRCQRSRSRRTRVAGGLHLCRIESCRHITRAAIGSERDRLFGRSLHRWLRAVGRHIFVSKCAAGHILRRNVARRRRICGRCRIAVSILRPTAVHRPKIIVLSIARKRYRARQAGAPGRRFVWRRRYRCRRRQRVCRMASVQRNKGFCCEDGVKDQHQSCLRAFLSSHSVGICAKIGRVNRQRSDVRSARSVCRICKQRFSTIARVVGVVGVLFNASRTRLI
jgi:hypothetical protein